MGRLSRFTLIAASVLAAAGCGHNPADGTLAAGQAAPGSTSPAPPSSTTPASTTPATPTTTTPDGSTVPPTVAPPDLETAGPAIVANLTGQGHSSEYATCVLALLPQRLDGAELRFAAVILSMRDPSAEQITAALDNTGVDRVLSVSLPDRIFAVGQECTPRDVPTDPAATPTSIDATPASTP